MELVTVHRTPLNDFRADVDDYFATLSHLIRSAEVTDRDGRTLPISVGFERTATAAHTAHNAGNKIVFIGNGGSAAIASHLAIDFSKNGRMRAMAFNDAAALTCIGNDLGYEEVFAKQIEFHARPGDLVIAISSSGASPNIVNAVEQGRRMGCRVVTFSGFAEANELRHTGDINFYVRSDQYGFVEVAHMSLCHAVLDLDLGWRKQGASSSVVPSGIAWKKAASDAF